MDEDDCVRFHPRTLSDGLRRTRNDHRGTTFASFETKHQEQCPLGSGVLAMEHERERGTYQQKSRHYRRQQSTMRYSSKSSPS
eukprot:2808728-Pyramimonas_sp.AAC.1